FSDYSIRVLMFLGHKRQPATVREISETFRISRNHLVKVAHRMGQLGLVRSTKGSRGGLELAKPPEEYRMGDIIMLVEPHMELAECFDSKFSRCPIRGYCGLQNALMGAHLAFI